MHLYDFSQSNEQERPHLWVGMVILELESLHSEKNQKQAYISQEPHFFLLFIES